MGLYPVTVFTAQCLAKRLQTRAHQHLPDSLQQTLDALRPVNQYGYMALRPVDQYGYISPCSRHLVFYAHSISTVISGPDMRTVKILMDKKNNLPATARFPIAAL